MSQGKGFPKAGLYQLSGIHHAWQLCATLLSSSDMPFIEVLRSSLRQQLDMAERVALLCKLGSHLRALRLHVRRKWHCDAASEQLGAYTRGVIAVSITSVGWPGAAALPRKLSVPGTECASVRAASPGMRRQRPWRSAGTWPARCSRPCYPS